jgi:hypothetical protein
MYGWIVAENILRHLCNALRPPLERGRRPLFSVSVGSIISRGFVDYTLGLLVTTILRISLFGNKLGLYVGDYYGFG